MAFRTKAQAGALLILTYTAPLMAAAPLVFPVSHRHPRGGGAGVLSVSQEGIAFEEAGRHRKHSRQWRFDDIQQLTLSETSLRLLTYEDQRWHMPGDREFVFDNLPKDSPARLYPLFSRQLDQRFVAALAENTGAVVWECPAKLLRWNGGAQGSILVGRETVVFRTDSAGQSRTWRIRDIEMVSTSGPFDLTVTTFERDRANYAARRDFHFALKHPVGDAEYNALWRQVNQARGLQLLNLSTQAGTHQ